MLIGSSRGKMKMRGVYIKGDGDASNFAYLRMLNVKSFY